MSANNYYNDIVLSAVTVLEDGGTMLYPTDTIWGIGCDATNAVAVEKIYAIKQRDHSKSMLILCEDLAMVEHFVGRIGEDAAKLLLASDRPTTVILPLTIPQEKSLDNIQNTKYKIQNSIATNLVALDGTIGVRIPRMDFCQQLLHELGRPVVSTSANFSGSPSPSSFAEIDDALKQRVDYCVPPEYELSSDGRGSRIVKVDTLGRITVIRP